MVNRNMKISPIREFILPILQNRCWTYNQNRTLLLRRIFLHYCRLIRFSIFSKHSSQEGNCLNGLSQSHVISKNASMVILVQLIQKFHSLSLMLKKPTID
uniref:Uncharacterized protein n=1 Tax=Opuntia streptacantha TaxID=393608 RepID=A0A7C9ACM5_OPUST